MNLETCKICNRDQTPSYHINGHNICQSCLNNAGLGTQNERALFLLGYAFGAIDHTILNLRDYIAEGKVRPILILEKLAEARHYLNEEIKDAYPKKSSQTDQDQSD